MNTQRDIVGEREEAKRGIEMKGWMREYFSIPNLLGYFRLILAVVYLAVCFEARTQQDYYIAAGIIGISMLSDLDCS